LPKIYQYLPLQYPTKFTQIRIFGFKIYHLATLLNGRNGAFATNPADYPIMSFKQQDGERGLT
jgi:hypothetical protein